MKFVRCLLVFNIILGKRQGLCQGVCKDGFIQTDPTVNICYRFEKAKNTWSDARDYCLYLDATLTKPKNQVQNDAIELIANSSMRHGIWLDGTKTNKTWTWTGQETIVWKNWKFGRPTVLEENACMGMLNGLWADDKCTDRMAYVCQHSIECASNPCKNGGQCQNGSCTCSPGFTGKHCGTMIHKDSKDNNIHRMVDCADSSSLCENNETCEMTEEGYRCVCKKGYQRNTTTFSCTDIDDCRITPPVCSFDNVDHGCVNTIGSFRCICEEGYENITPVLCVISISSPHRPNRSEELYGYTICIASQAIHILAVIFFSIVVAMDLKLFLSIMYIWITTEPVSDSDTDDTDEEKSEDDIVYTVPAVHTTPGFSVTAEHPKFIFTHTTSSHKTEPHYGNLMSSSSTNSAISISQSNTGNITERSREPSQLTRRESIAMNYNTIPGQFTQSSSEYVPLDINITESTLEHAQPASDSNI